MIAPNCNTTHRPPPPPHSFLTISLLHQIALTPPPPPIFTMLTSSFLFDNHFCMHAIRQRPGYEGLYALMHSSHDLYATKANWTITNVECAYGASGYYCLRLEDVRRGELLVDSVWCHDNTYDMYSRGSYITVSNSRFERTGRRGLNIYQDIGLRSPLAGPSHVWGPKVLDSYFSGAYEQQLRIDLGNTVQKKKERERERGGGGERGKKKKKFF